MVKSSAAAAASVTKADSSEVKAIDKIKLAKKQAPDAPKATDRKEHATKPARVPVHLATTATAAAKQKKHSTHPATVGVLGKQQPMHTAVAKKTVPAAGVAKRRPAQSSSKVASETSATLAAAEPLLDSYGQGCPTDRLQFGYAPAVSAEAVAFYACMSKQQWLQARKGWWTWFVKAPQGQLTQSGGPGRDAPNCEPITSQFKLQHHWKQAAQGKPGGGMSGQEHGARSAEDEEARAEKFISALAARQQKQQASPTSAQNGGGAAAGASRLSIGHSSHHQAAAAVAAPKRERPASVDVGPTTPSRSARPSRHHTTE